MITTLQQRIEAKEQFMSWKDKQPHFLKRNQSYDPRNNIVAVLGKKEGKSIIPKWIFGKNIVTDDGDIYYALKGAGETPATNENFIQGRMELRTGSATPAKGDTYTDVTTPVTASRPLANVTLINVLVESTPFSSSRLLVEYELSSSSISRLIVGTTYGS